MKMAKERLKEVRKERGEARPLKNENFRLKSRNK